MSLGRVSRRVSALWCAFTLCCLWSQGCGDALGYWVGDEPSVAPDDGLAAAPANQMPTAGGAARNPVPPSAAKEQAHVADCAPAAPPSEPCTLAAGARLPAVLTLEQGNQIEFFAEAANLPAGNYRLEYIGGCTTFALSGLPTRQELDQLSSFLTALRGDNTSGDAPIDLATALDISDTLGWSVHANIDVTSEEMSVWLLQNSLPFRRAPGSTGVAAAAGAFSSYGECVQANCQSPDRFIDFYFSGGNLALRYTVAAVLYGVMELTPGTSEGARGSTFRLSRLDACDDAAFSGLDL